MFSHDGGPGGGWVCSWHAPPPPTVTSMTASLTVEAFATGYNRALQRPWRIRVERLPVAPPLPRAMSVAMRPEIPAVRSFRFVVPSDLPVPEAAGAAPAKAGAVGVTGGLRATASACATRIRPPSDVIKLEDRLHYLLEPPLELLLAERRLAFPCPPFAFQLAGVAFLFPRHAAILADEMGLGKTMQAITAIRLLLRCGEVRSVLLVAPKSLVSNWRREFECWAPEVPVLTIEGDQARRAWQWQVPGVPVKLTNYELLPRDREVFCAADSMGRPRVGFDLVVLDESQRIKNRSSLTAQSACAIPRRRSWALTGTPVENSPEDLVGIFEFLAPGFLSPEINPRRLGRTIRDYVLRRTKEQVLSDLPPKLFRDAELELTPEQRQTYDLAENQGVLRLSAMGRAATIRHVFELVLRLKQICNFDPATGASAKLERLQADLEELAASRRKAIVFSQWVETLQHLARDLRRFGPLLYHGGVPPRRRDAVVRQFRDDATAHVLLMTYGAGGVGLNLQFADYVFLFDRWWNPAVEDQAINRAHRIGVAGPVTVTRFLTLDTIEQRIDAVLREKRELFETIFSETPAPTHLGLTQQELFGLFDLKCPAGETRGAA